MIPELFRHILIFTAIFIALAFNSCSKFRDESPAEKALNSGEGLRIGVAVADISPEEIDGIDLGGYEPRTSNGLHDPLTARCIVIIDDETVVALISLDLIGMFKSHTNKIKHQIVRETGLDEDHIFLHSIHTHSGPSMLNFGLSTISYRSRLSRRITNAVIDALETNVNVTAIISSGHSSAGTINRRYPE